MTQHCIVYAINSSYIYEVEETLYRLGWDVKAWVMNQDGEPPANLAPVATIATLDRSMLARYPILVPLVTPGYRRTVERELLAFGVSNFAKVLDPTTVLARSARIEEGVYVNGGGMIGAHVVLQRWSHVNRSVSIGHHSVLEPYATLGPGSLLCGNCIVGKGAFVGAGAVVNPKVRIGANAVVGAGAVVTKDVPANTVVVGAPARVVRDAIPGYNGVGV